MKKILSILLALALFIPCISMINVSAAATGTISGANLDLGSTLTLNYYATFSGAEASDVKMRFTSSSGRESIVDGVYDNTYKKYKFAYTGINPQCMSDVIKAELVYNDTVLATKDNYSVKAYCESQIIKNADDLDYNTIQIKAFRTLLADILTYGSAAQVYRDYNTGDLADTLNTWISVYKSEFSLPNGVREISGNSDANNKVVSVGLTMANVNRIYFKLALSENATVTLNDKAVDRETLKKNSDGTYTLYTEDLTATDFDKVYTVKVNDGSKTVSTVSYNVKAYVKAKYADSTVSDIVKALYNYGVSAKAYVKALESSTGGDFDLGVEDTLDETINLIPAINSNFDDAARLSDTNWYYFGSVTMSIDKEGYEGKCLHVGQNGVAYNTAMLDIAPYITEAGAYTISFMYKVKGSDGNSRSLSGVVRTDSQTSFTGSTSPFYCDLADANAIEDDKWYQFTDTICIKTKDIGAGGKWGLGLHQINSEITDVYFDNVTITKKVFSDQPQAVTQAETWVANEVTLISDKWYDECFYDVDVDLLLTNGVTTYTIPAFWDGGYTWRARFACPTEGTWTYITRCTDTDNYGLHNVTNTFECTNYSGDLDIYKHGFVKTEANKKYFMYNDGTPFFYLGDTHWGLGGEPFEVTKAVVDKRVEQGFTVWQSEPLNSTFDFANGITESDINGLRAFDKQFKYIAENGLVHANAQFFFPSAMRDLITRNGGYSAVSKGTAPHKLGNAELYDISDTAKAELERISRYWVARYSAYPVMWTLGQEIDNDYYWEKTTSGSEYQGHEAWGYLNNPYKYVAEYIYKYDPYKSPLTGHMEYASASATTSVSGGVLASTSAFRDVEAHTWYAAQWSPSLTGGSLKTIASDFWNNSQGKPVVNYEGRYCFLWTKNFGARAQGWMSYLSGMFGYGYGAQDTWCYLSTYSENEDRSDGVDNVTALEKQAATWQDSMEYSSAYQVGYMRDFFENIVGDWYNLIPRTDPYSGEYLVRDTNAYAIVASNSDNSKTVAYFYNFSDATLAETPNSPSGGTKTGTFNMLTPNAKYNYLWFNPVTGKVDSRGTFTANASGQWYAGAKSTGDMVLYIYK